MAGGWSGLIFGRMGESPQSRGSSSNSQSSTLKSTGATVADGGQPRQNVEQQIRELAKALGLPSRELASAIAQAVQHHLPPASLSSVSAAEATHSGAAVNILVGADEDEGSAGSTLKDNLAMLSSLDDPAEIGALD